MARRGDPHSLRLRVLTVGIAILAGIGRVAFVVAVLASSQRLPADRPGFFTADSPFFLEPAKELLRGNLGGAGTLRCPPGYPAFLAAMGAKPTAILLGQAALGAVIVVGTILMTYILTRSLALAGGAGLLSAVSPTGIGLTGLVMADLLFAAVFAIGLLLLVASARYREPRWLLAAGLLFGLGALVKPILSAWAPFSVLIAWLVAGRTMSFAPVRSIILFLLLQLVPAQLWAARNYAREGVFAVSDRGWITARLYLGAQTEARGKRLAHSGAELQKLQQSMRENLSRMGTGAEQIRWAESTTLQIMHAYPKHAVRAYLDNIDASTATGWNFFGRQLRSYPGLQTPLRRFVQLEAWTRSHARWLLLAAAALAVAALFLRRAGRLEQLALDICALAMAVSFFVALSGMTFWTGPRIVYPASMAAAAMTALALQGARVVVSPKPTRGGEGAT